MGTGLIASTTQAGLVYDLRFADGSHTKNLTSADTFTVELWARVSGTNGTSTDEGLANSYVQIGSTQNVGQTSHQLATLQTNTWQKFTMPSTMWQFGGGIISDDGKKSLFDSEGTVAAFQYWYDLMYKHFVCPPAVPGATGGGDLMKTNSLAFWWDGSWSLNFFKDNPDVAAVTKATRLNSLAGSPNSLPAFDRTDFVFHEVFQRRMGSG